MRWAAAAGAGVLLLPMLVIGGAVGGGGSAPAGGGGWGGRPESLADIPAAYLDLYRQAAARFGIPVEILAAVGKVECDHGRNPDCAVPNTAGAVGPMQFLPSTFAAYAWASGSASPSILDPADAIFAAAALLAASGVAADPWSAVYAYNHADWYVAEGVAWAVAYGWAPADPEVLSRAALAHPSVELRWEAADDVAAGRVDDRLLAVLLVVATTHRLGSVGPFVTGHSTYVAETDRVSLHTLGRAVDLPVVDGRPVSAANAGARAVAEEFLAMPPSLRPHELGSPWPDLAGPGAFSDDGHRDHLHVSAPADQT